MQYQAPQQWLDDIWASLPFQQMASLNLARYDTFPTLAQMQTWMPQDWGIATQDELDTSQLYYEQYIAKYHRIPTRSNNWHDLFNAVIWHQFPATKAHLNQLHMSDIQQYGVHPRTNRRNRITQWDECGVILAVKDGAQVDALAQHQWQNVFIEQRQAWGTAIDAMIFGHAIFEMLLAPFIGLTAKWLAIEVPSAYWQQSADGKAAILDELLCAKIVCGEIEFKDKLCPIPILGIPGWFPANKDAEFYQNSAYFRPKSNR